MVNRYGAHLILWDTERQIQEDILLYFFITTSYEVFIKFRNILDSFKTIQRQLF